LSAAASRYRSARAYAAAFEVLGQLGGDVGAAVSVPGLLPLCDGSMQTDAPRFRDPLVEHVAVEHVGEPITAARRPVRPWRPPRLAQEGALRRQRFAALLDLLDPPVHRCRQRRDRKLGARDACRFQKAAVVRRQSLQLPFDELAEVVGNQFLHVLDRRGESPPPVVLGDQTVVDEVIEHLHHEQCITLCASVDGTREPGRHGTFAQSIGDVLPHGRGTE
jgi:hypothetical protein